MTPGIGSVCVTEFTAAQNEDTLAATLDADADAGASRPGELGIGMNRAIDQFSDNVLFDEKMSDTVHLTLDQVHEENVPVERNESSIHGVVVAMSKDSRIEVDGEIVQRDGTLRFEDGFAE